MPQPSTGAITDIHVIVDVGGDRGAVRLAVGLARTVQAHLTGLALSFEPLIPMYTMAAPISTQAIIAAHDAAVEEGTRAKAAFEKIAGPAGIPIDARAMPTIAGEGFAELIEMCRVSDLVIVSQEDPDRREPMRRSLIEALLFDAAAPVLLVPYVGADQLRTGRAMVAWDGSASASRALRAALPLLKMTAEVTLAMVAEEKKWAGGLPGADVADHLSRHGVRVEVKRLDNPMGDVAATLLNAVADEETDWMVMGAYGHSRVREFLLGGVTRSLIDAATVPVLMAH